MTEEIIRAKRFELVDDEERTRATIGLRLEGTGVTLLDQNENERASLYVGFEDVGFEETVLSLHDETGTQCIGASVTDSGRAVFTVGRTEGQDKSAQLSFDPEDETVGIFLGDETKTIRAGIQLHPDGLPLIFLHDSNRNERVKLSELENGQIGLAILDSDGRVRINIALSGDEDINEYPSISLLNEDMRSGVFAMAKSPDGRARIAAIDEDGESRGF